MVNENCRATFGAVSHPERNLRSEGKAGRMRWKGYTPHSPRYSDEPR